MSATRSTTPGARSKTRAPGVEGGRHRFGHGRDIPPTGGHVDRLDGGAGAQGDRQQLGALDHQAPLGPAQAALPQQLTDPSDPLVGERQPGLAQEAASAVVGAFASASSATFTSEANASGAVTARSASTLRSTSTSAACSPAMNRL